MMNVTHKTKQRTFIVEGEKIMIKSYPRTLYGNFIGGDITINSTRLFSGYLTREEAEDSCPYVRWGKGEGR